MVAGGGVVAHLPGLPGGGAGGSRWLLGLRVAAAAVPRRSRGFDSCQAGWVPSGPSPGGKRDPLPSFTWRVPG